MYLQLNCNFKMKIYFLNASRYNVGKSENWHNLLGK